MSRIVGITAPVALLFLLSGAALAQPLAPTPLMGEKPTDSPAGNGLTFFSSFDASWTPYTATYDGKRMAEALQQGTADITRSRLTFDYTEKSQRLLSLGGTAGVRWTLLERLHFAVGIGASYLMLEEKTYEPNSQAAAENYDGDHEEFYTIKPNPGFSAMLGVTWEPVRTSHISLLLGLQFQYLSAYGLRGHSLEGTLTVPDSTTTFAEINVTDMEMHLFTLEPYVGVLWRAVGSFAVNSFGVFNANTFSLGTMTKEIRTSSRSGDVAAHNKTTFDIDLSMKPTQIFGAYYGWYFNTPHVGTFGVEIQLGARWNAGLSYQYTF